VPGASLSPARVVAVRDEAAVAQPPAEKTLGTVEFGGTFLDQGAQRAQAGSALSAQVSGQAIGGPSTFWTSSPPLTASLSFVLELYSNKRIRWTIRQDAADQEARSLAHPTLSHIQCACTLCT
jgi:hypothetical protein